MESSAAPSVDGSASVEPVDEGGTETPLTTAQSGLPIAPVYAGFANRRRCFKDGFEYCRG